MVQKQHSQQHGTEIPEVAGAAALYRSSSGSSHMEQKQQKQQEQQHGTEGSWEVAWHKSISGRSRMAQKQHGEMQGTEAERRPAVWHRSSMWGSIKIQKKQQQHGME